MSTISVWAPRAQTVELVAKGQNWSMTADDAGWWHSDKALTHGEDYSFRVNDQGPFPDPRSPWQPEGVHGPSRAYDHHQYPWQCADFRPPPLGSAIIYEVHIGTFTPEGTFAAAEAKLDYLVALGVTHVELCPVNEFSGDHGWGYDGVDLFAPHHGYGGPDALKALVDACHAKGLAVILDVVYNHLGPSGNYLSQFGPYFTTKYHTPWGEAVNLDGPESDQVRRFFLDNALMWLRDFRFDGLRLDAIHAFIDESAVHLLEQLAREVDHLGTALGRELCLIAESDLNNPRIVSPYAVGGYGMDAQWSDDFHHALHALLTGERQGYYQDFGTVAQVAKALQKGYIYDGGYSRYRHRAHGRPAPELSGHCLLGYLQNHDQVGNRAVGDRSSHLLTTGQLKIGAALVLTAPFVPMLFQGEEWAASTPFLYFTNHPEQELGEAVKHGRQSEFSAFGWNPEEVPDPQADETFAQSKLLWHELDEGEHSEVWDWHRQLIALRKHYPELLTGALDRVQVEYDEHSQWLLMRRGTVVVACNFNTEPHTLERALFSSRHLKLASTEAVNLSGRSLSLPGHGVAVLV